MNEEVEQGDDHESTIIMTDEAGQEIEMMLVHSFNLEQETYAVLLEKDNPEGDGMITRVVQEGEETYLAFIEDDAEWDRVVTAYNAEIAAIEND